MSSRGYYRRQRERAIAKNEQIIAWNQDKFHSESCSGRLAKGRPRKSDSVKGSRGTARKEAIRLAEMRKMARELD